MPNLTANDRLFMFHFFVPVKTFEIIHHFEIGRRLFTRNSILDFFSSSLIAGWLTAPSYPESPYTTSSSSLMRFAVSVTSCIIRPALSRQLLTSAKSFSPNLFDSSICLNFNRVVTSGTCCSWKSICIKERIA